MNSNQKSYLQIFKATSLFGGVQVVNIIISIIRSKIIAILLGPSGMGVAGLFTSATSLVGGLTNFGLGTSAVRNVASAYKGENLEQVSKVVMVFRRLVWITGLLGTSVTLILSRWLSELTFGNTDYTAEFRWLSLTLLFNQLTSGQNVLLQGMRKLRYLARANVAGSAIGLAVSTPIYYFWHIDGIMPAIVFSSLISLCIAYFFASKLKIPKIPVPWQMIKQEGGDMMRMGIMISLTGLITLASSYIVRIYISNSGGIDEVGLYNAGFAIITTYVGMVFTAMGTDYYPRLSSVAHDSPSAMLLINQQAEIAVLILAPILTVFLIFINLVIILLYSTKFVPINGMVHWAALGIFFKAASWPIGFILLAKGASKTFFWSELLANGYLLLFNILGYKFLGLDGMGLSFLISYILVLIQIYLIAKFKYNFKFMGEFIKLFSIQLSIGIICFFITRFIPTPWSYFVGGIMICLSFAYSFKELDKRLELKKSINSRVFNKQ